jgi:hypothetical protein
MLALTINRSKIKRGEWPYECRHLFRQFIRDESVVPDAEPRRAPEVRPRRRTNGRHQQQETAQLCRRLKKIKRLTDEWPAK